MKISYIFFVMGLIAVLLIGLVFLLFQSIFGFFPGWMVKYILIYYFLLAFLWLCFAILYMLKQTWLCTIFVALGIFIVHLVMTSGKPPLSLRAN